MNPSPIQLKFEDRQIIQAILRRHLPATSQVWVFGSRARGSARKYSDIDLAIDHGGKSLPLEVVSDLAADFEESALPFTVDIVDLNAICSDFRNLIEQDKIPFPFSTSED